MPDAYTTNGKEVLDRGRHFADATTPDDALLIARALNGHGAKAPSEKAR